MTTHDPSPSSPTSLDSHPTVDAKDPNLEVDRVNSSVGSENPPSPKAFPPKSVWPFAILATIAVLVGVGLKIYQDLNRGSAVVSQEEQAPSRLPVRVVRAEVSLSRQWVFDEGFVRSVRQRVLNFETEGDIRFIAKVDGRDLREGDRVSQGQLLATIDDRKEVVAIETAEADLNVSIQEYNQANSQLLQAKADFDKSRSDLDLAATELRRYQSLFEDGAVAESDRDVRANSKDQAEAALRVSEQDIRAAEDGVRSAQARVEAARARLREAKVDLEDTQLVSPIDGVVAYINIREGEYWDDRRISTIVDRDEVVEAAPIVVIKPQALEVELELQADRAQEIRPGQIAHVVLEGNVSAAEAIGATSENLLAIAQEQGSQGQVFAVSPTQTPGGRGVRIVIRDLQSTQNLRVGGRVYVWIETAIAPNAVTVPIGALLPGEGTFYAFVADESSGAVERREVERGIEGLDGIVEVLSGIEPGELVVTEGKNRLVDGTLVEIVSPTEAE